MTTDAASADPSAPEDAILPAELPPPQSPAQRSFVFAILVGLFAALFAALCQFAVGRGIYMFLLFGAGIGAMVGCPFAWALKRIHATNRGLAAVSVVLLMGLTYFLFSFAIYANWMYHNFGYAAMRLSAASYFDNLGILANKFVLFQQPLGAWGAVAAWTLDYFAACYLAWGAVDLVLMWETVRHVPHAVARTVFLLKREGYKDDHIRQRLAERGWSRPEDQTAALRAAAAAERLHRLGVVIFKGTTRSATA